MVRLMLDETTQREGMFIDIYFRYGYRDYESLAAIPRSCEENARDASKKIQ